HLVPEAEIRVETGKPGVAAVEVRIRGGDDATVYQLSQQVKDIVGSTPGAADTWSSQAPGSPEARLVPDRLRGPDAGVTVDVTAAALRPTPEGAGASKFRGQGERANGRRRIADPPLADDPRAPAG